MFKVSLLVTEILRDRYNICFFVVILSLFGPNNLQKLYFFNNYLSAMIFIIIFIKSFFCRELIMFIYS